MADQDGMRREIERQLALNEARSASEAAARKPEITLEGVVRAGVRTAAKTAIKGVGAIASGVAGGLADAQKDVNANSEADHPVVVVTSTTPGGWIERQKAKIDATISDLANTRVPLRWRAMLFSARKGLTYWQWSGRTYPHILRPLSWAAHKVRNRLDEKIALQGRATDWQKLRRRLLSIGPATGFIARSRYRLINTATAFVGASTVLTAALDAAYSYTTYHEYKDVTITNIFRSPERDNHVNEVHGYQIGSNGNRQPLFFNVQWNPFYLIFFPQYIVSDMSDGDVCNIHTWGTSTRIPLSVRRLLSANPHIISADCHSLDRKQSKFLQPFAGDYYKNTHGRRSQDEGADWRVRGQSALGVGMSAIT